MDLVEASMEEERGQHVLDWGKHKFRRKRGSYFIREQSGVNLVFP
jgi:hypothetical protein